MEEPRIDPTWTRDRHFKLRPFLAVGVAMLLLVLCLLLSTMKGCTALGETASNDVFEQSEESGFIKKTNDLLEMLLADTVSNGTKPVLVTNMDSLHKKYPALMFALPYSADAKAVVEASDLRLVGIHPERIKDENMRNFYYNSRLPQLLRQQRNEMAETYFDIKTKGTTADGGKSYDPTTHKKPIDIVSIKLHASMFKVALKKNPWHGVVYAKQNCLFDENNAVFLTYGSSMIPIPKERSHDSIAASAPIVEAVLDTAMLLQRGGQPIDYYRHYQSAFDRSNPSRGHSISIRMCQHKGSRPIADVQISSTATSLRIVATQKVCVFRGNQKAKVIEPVIYGSAKNADTVSICDGMKLAVYNKDNNSKLGEFTLHTSDPTSILSSLIQTNVGTSRYTIASNQTDLFTQQVVRGITRHMSDRDGITDIRLTLDPMLSLELEKAATDYIHQMQRTIKTPGCQKNQQYDISVTVMDMATGEVLATPFYTTKFDDKDYPEALKTTTRNVALSRRYIGSTFKPILAAAAVQANPNLLNLDTHGCYHLTPLGNNKFEAVFFGHKTKAWAKTPDVQKQWNGTTFTNFLAHSDDVYPVALAALAMTGNNTSRELSLKGENNYFRNKGGYLYFRTAGESPEYTTHPFTNWLAYITRANYDNFDDKDGHQDPFHELKLQQLANLKAKGVEISDDDLSFGLREVSPDITNLYYNIFRDGGEFRTYLAPWVLGQGNNEWSTLTMAQAWARMVGRRDVYASFIKTKGETVSLSDSKAMNVPGCCITNGNTPRSKAQIDGTWNEFLDRLSAAPSVTGDPGGNNTLIRMHSAVGSVINSKRKADPMVLFCKTGTPDAYSRYEVPLMGGNNRFFDIGMFSFVLAPQSQVNAIKGGKTGHGIVCIVRLTRTYQCDKCNAAVRRGGTQCSTCLSSKCLESSHARNFFSQTENGHLQMLYDMTLKYYQGS